MVIGFIIIQLIKSFLIGRLMDVARKLDVNEEADNLRVIANHLRRLGAVAQACDVLRKLADHETLLNVLVESNAWNEALIMVKEQPEYRKSVYLPYARWLAEQEQFIEAQKGDLAPRLLGY